MNQVDKAIRIAVQKHEGQYRKSLAIPYVSHCFDVMKRAREYGIVDENVLTAAMLHDTVEDTDLTLNEIESEFNKEVRDVVEELTMPDSVKGFMNKYDYLKSFSEKSFEAVVLKFADRCSNVDDYLLVPKSRGYAIKYALQAYPIYKTLYEKFSGYRNEELLGDLDDIRLIIQEEYGIDIRNTTDREVKEALKIRK